jgi:hypothetical protein
MLHCLDQPILQEKANTVAFARSHHTDSDMQVEVNAKGCV